MAPVEVMGVDKDDLVDRGVLGAWDENNPERVAEAIREALGWADLS